MPIQSVAFSAGGDGGRRSPEHPLVDVIETYGLFCSRTPAACSREASRSASDNLSKCSGFLLRSSFAILAARTRHLISVARMAAFSDASKLSNSSDILLADIFRAAPTAVGRLLRAPGSKL